MNQRAAGPFEVSLQNLPSDAAREGVVFGRRSLDKQFHGDLEATSKGEMLFAGTSVQGSAGYVAIEWVTGSLHGKPGTFALQHSGNMERGVPTLSVAVVPDSGTEALVGLRGRMDIILESGKHSYVFEYDLP